MTMKPYQRILLTALAALSTAVMARELPNTPGDLMDVFSWDTRPLFVFSPETNGDAVDRLQQHWNRTQAEWQDRNMALVTTVGDGPIRINGVASAIDPTDMRRFFTVKNDEFVVMLVGYDGEVKLRRSDPEILQAVYDLIDTMPIRQSEMLSR